jgi:hypothetical protein
MNVGTVNVENAWESFLNIDEWSYVAWMHALIKLLTL